VATSVGYPTATARRALEELAVHGVVDRRPGQGNRGDEWRLTDWAVGLLQDCVPEKSGTACRQHEEAPPLNNSHSPDDDFSDQQADESRRSSCWRCGDRVDSACDAVCRGCAWIVCTTCSACQPDCPGDADPAGQRVQVSSYSAGDRIPCQCVGCDGCRGPARDLHGNAEIAWDAPQPICRWCAGGSGR
jgi:hypothetical protein